ncbi:MAG: hypothetical protein JWP74_1727 [Marmoricola sp.]|nr:hypothetical protein [Marmoricola sp.]
MSTRTTAGLPLTPGVNVDSIDYEAGLRMAAHLGYDDPQAQTVATYALQRHARGEEDGAFQTWLSYYPRDLTSWYAVLACAGGGR